MSYTHNDYWAEALSSSFEEHGVTVSSEQLKAIADDMDGAHENIGMAFYQPSENPLARELADTKRALEVEQRKVHCEVCDGKGVTHTYGGTMMSTSQCWKCRGEGRHS